MLRCYPSLSNRETDDSPASTALAAPAVRGSPVPGFAPAGGWPAGHFLGRGFRIFVLEWNIIRAIAPNPAYHIWDGLGQNPGPQPDYVVTHINTLVPQSWWTRNFAGEVYQTPYDPAWLFAGYTKVFSVPRAFGLEMAAVWKRN